MEKIFKHLSSLIKGSSKDFKNTGLKLHIFSVIKGEEKTRQQGFDNFGAIFLVFCE